MEELFLGVVIGWIGHSLVSKNTGGSSVAFATSIRGWINSRRLLKLRLKAESHGFADLLDDEWRSYDHLPHSLLFGIEPYRAYKRAEARHHALGKI